VRRLHRIGRTRQQHRETTSRREATRKAFPPQERNTQRFAAILSAMNNFKVPRCRTIGLKADMVNIPQLTIN
jgi:hypothetical protein